MSKIPLVAILGILPDDIFFTEQVPAWSEFKTFHTSAPFTVFAFLQISMIDYPF
jgi:hypothetical protein